jgi:hypothetical protein
MSVPAAILLNAASGHMRKNDKKFRFFVWQSVHHCSHALTSSSSLLLLLRVLLRVLLGSTILRWNSAKSAQNTSVVPAILCLITIITLITIPLIIFITTLITITITIIIYREAIHCSGESGIRPEYKGTVGGVQFSTPLHIEHE